MIEKVITIARIGISIGKVMKRKRCQLDAPSSSAASYSDGEMVCSPASSEIATKGMPRQMFAAMSEKRAGHSLPRKLMFVSRQPSTCTKT